MNADTITADLQIGQETSEVGANMDASTSPTDPQVDGEAIQDTSEIDAAWEDLAAIDLVEDQDDEETITPTAHTFETPANNQVEHFILEAHKKLFASDQPGESASHQDFSRQIELGRTYNAHFFDPETYEMLTDSKVIGKIGIKIEAHMTHLKLYVSDVNKEEIEQSNTPSHDDTSEKKEEVDDLRKRSTKIFAYINYVAFGKIRVTDIASDKIAGYPVSVRKEIRAWPDTIKDLIRKTERYGACPLYAELTFNPTCIAGERLQMGTPEWAEPFGRTVLSGKIGMIIHGHPHTIDQLKLLHDMLQFQKDGRNPLDQWHIKGKRRVLKEDRVNIAGLGALENYKYEPRYSFHSWDEYSTVYVIAMLQEHSALRARTWNYEQRVHKLHLLVVPGANDSIYLGFLPLPEEDELRLTPGTSLKVTFMSGPKEIEDEIDFEYLQAVARYHKFELEDEYQSTSHDINSLEALLQARDNKEKTEDQQTKSKLIRDLVVIYDDYTESLKTLPKSMGQKIQSESAEQTEALIQLMCEAEDYADEWTAAIGSAAKATADEADADTGVDADEDEETNAPPAPKSKGNSSWRAQVTRQYAGCPADMIPVHIWRPWHKKEGEWDEREVSAIMSQGASAQDIPRYIKADPGHPVRVAIDDSDDTLKHNIVALEALNFQGKDDLYCEWNAVWTNLLVGGPQYTIQAEDILEDVASQLDQDLGIVLPGINRGQRKCIEYARRAHARIQIIHGPPGTGKTYTMILYATLFFKAEEAHNILFISPSNKAVDVIARELQMTLSNLQEEGKAPKNRYILRAYSKGAEEQIQAQEMKKGMPRDPKSRPPVGDVALEELDDASVLLREHYNVENTYTYSGIHDKRVNDLELSVGYRMMLVAGIIDPGRTSADTDRWTDFRFLFKQKANPETPLDKEQKKEYAEMSTDLYIHVIQHASAVVSTTTGAGSPKFLRAIQSRVSIIIHDEAAHDREDNLFPIFAAQMTKCKGFVCVGDHKQLRPITHGTQKEVVFINQIGISFMARLIGLGFPVCELTVQSRMVPTISTLANTLTYEGKLKNSRLCQISRRGAAEAFRQYTKTLTQPSFPPTNVVYIDAEKKSRLNQVEFGANHSRYNDYIVCIVVNMVQKLLQIYPGASVAILTGYVAQRNSYLSAKAAMQIDKVPNVHNLHISTFDGAQGDQFDYVIIDLLITNTAGFMRDPRRLNVAITRARNGLVIIGCKQNIDKLKFDGFYLKKLQDLLLKHRLPLSSIKSSMHKPDVYPACKYFTPKAGLEAPGWILPAQESIFKAVDSKALVSNDNQEISEATENDGWAAGNVQEEGTFRLWHAAEEPRATGW